MPPQPYELVNRTSGQSVTHQARVLDGPLQRARGLMLRRDLPESSAFIFEYDKRARRGVHMVLVFEALDVIWLQDKVVMNKSTLQPFVGHASHQADAFIEFPAGGADGIRVGDKLDWGRR